MKLNTVVFLAALAVVQPAGAQTLTIPTDPITQTATGSDAASTKPSPLAASDAATPQSQSPFFLKEIGHDVVRFFSMNTAKTMSVFAMGGLVATHWDSAAVEDAGELLSRPAAKAGNSAGGIYAQLGAAFGTYLVGRSTHNAKIAELGGDLVRSQILSQIVVQGAKFAVNRERPDGSNSLSFPSGHTASAFASATVLQNHFGWKIGVPAYAMAGFVGASRMASNKHYMSDVLIGAGIGVAAGQTVTVHLGREKFALGAAPTQGGAVVTFTRR